MSQMSLVGKITPQTTPTPHLVYHPESLTKAALRSYEERALVVSAVLKAM